MSGTDVAQVARDAPVGDEPDVSSRSPARAFLKTWLPFPLILGVLLFAQLRTGSLDVLRGGGENEPGLVFEGAAADLPLLLQALQDERARLQREWADVRDVKSRLLLEAGEIERRQRDVNALLERVENRVQVLESERDGMLRQLARVYGTMRPDAAAQILAGIDEDTSTEILRRMRERAAAQVMASLEPHSAARISQRMLRTP